MPHGKVTAAITGQAFGGASVKFSLGGLSWIAGLLRLEVQREDDTGAPGDFVAKIIERLPYTPVEAVGNNFEFVVTAPAQTAISNLSSAPLASHLVSAGYEALGSSFSLHVKSRADALLEITSQVQMEGGNILQFNFHRECASAGQAARASRLFSEDEEEANALVAFLSKILMEAKC